MNAQLGQILDKWYKETQKIQMPLLESLEKKQRTASLTRWTWVWVNSGRRWWTGRPGVLRFMGLQWVGHDWVTELNWTGYSFFGLNLPCSSNCGGFCFRFEHWPIFSFTLSLSKNYCCSPCFYSILERRPGWNASVSHLSRFALASLCVHQTLSCSPPVPWASGLQCSHVLPADDSGHMMRCIWKEWSQ